MPTKDYSLAQNWVQIPRDYHQVDTLYFYPTIVSDPRKPQIVSTTDEVLRAGAADYVAKQGGAFEESTNVYAPYYRQANLAHLIGQKQDAFEALLLSGPFDDVCASLDYYFEHYNNGKPFILAGHSQGSMVVRMILMRYMKEHPEYLARMVAAYALGYSITTSDLAEATHLKFAQGEDDTGVIVSWNTEGTGNKNAVNEVVQPGALSINPLNWKRDESPAPASLNLGGLTLLKDDLGEYEPTTTNLADATLDTERGVVIVSTRDDFITLPGIPADKNPFGPCSFHMGDYAFYYKDIQKNVRTRINAYLT